MQSHLQMFLYCLMCSVPAIIVLFSLVQQKWVTRTVKQNHLTLTAIVYMLNTRCILFLGQPSDACYVCGLIDVFLALSTTNNKLYWENVSSTPRAWDQPGPTMHRTDIQKSCPLVTTSFQVFPLMLEQPPTSWVTAFSACRMEEVSLGHQVWSCAIGGIHVIQFLSHLS